MKLHAKSGLLIATALTAVAGIIVRQMVNKGGSEPPVHDLKTGALKAVGAVRDGGTKVLDTVKPAIMRLVSRDGQQLDDGGHSAGDAELGNTARVMTGDSGSIGQATQDMPGTKLDTGAATQAMAG